jgi:hypothetical protein
MQSEIIRDHAKGAGQFMFRIFRIAVALTLSGFAGALAFAVVYLPPRHYPEFLLSVSPIVFFLSVPLGGVLYAVLAKFMHLTTPTCIAAGAVLGAVPGVLLWEFAGPLAPGTEIPEHLLVQNRLNILLYAAFGAVGGIAFAILSRVLRIR